MLLQFTVGNYLSFRDRVSLSLIAHPAGGPIPERRVFALPDGRAVLKTVAIYGANASGKSNLYKAIEHLRSATHRESRFAGAEVATP